MHIIGQVTFGALRRASRVGASHPLPVQVDNPMGLPDRDTGGIIPSRLSMNTALCDRLPVAFRTQRPVSWLWVRVFLMRNNCLSPGEAKSLIRDQMFPVRGPELDWHQNHLPAWGNTDPRPSSSSASDSPR